MSMDDKEAVEKLHSVYGQMKEELSQVIVGQEEVVEQVLMAIFCRGHALLVGVPGLAKTLLVSTVAQAVDLSFKRIQFTPDLMPADITGTDVLEMDKETGRRSFRFVEGPVFANMILADEINRTPPKTQAALLEAMQEHHVTVGEKTCHLPKPFFVLATQNPIEQEGTYPLPEAQLDRFLLKVTVNYPSKEEELLIMDRMASTAPVEDTRQVVEPATIEAGRQVLDQIYIDPAVREYIVDLVNATRYPAKVDTSLKPLLRAGASPRASINLALACRARAFMESRSFVTPQDVKQLARDILRHRILLSYEAEAEDLSSDIIIERILSKVPVP